MVQTAPGGDEALLGPGERGRAGEGHAGRIEGRMHLHVPTRLTALAGLGPGPS